MWKKWPTDINITSVALIAKWPQQQKRSVELATINLSVRSDNNKSCSSNVRNDKQESYISRSNLDSWHLGSASIHDMTLKGYIVLMKTNKSHCCHRCCKYTCAYL